MIGRRSSRSTTTGGSSARSGSSTRHVVDQPSLEEVAREIGLSPFHAQRLFTRWAGISPKRFLGLLTVGHAKAALQAGESVLDASYEVGLSGPSRLHDLFVGFEAMTPGEYKQQGAGLTIRYGIHPTRFGEALLLATERGIGGLSFVDGDPEEALAEARAAWPLSRLVARSGRDRRAGPAAVRRRWRGAGRRRSCCSRAPTSRSRCGRRCCGCRPGASCPTSTSPARSASRGRCARSPTRSRTTRSATSCPATA